ncbi:MAG: adenylate kinase [Lachnospiraceae bacterium]|nr:adenylate kinase [Lachnospiraceae bacterium]
MNIIMLGAPGAGKGTIAALIKEKYNLPHISTGDIFRANIKEETELGKLAKSYIDKGALVPDDVTINMVMDRLSNDDCKSGYILDGFPRTIVQATEFEKALQKSNTKIDVCILVDGDDDMIANRLSGRRVCEKCGASYHIEHMKPVKEGICDKCGGNLIHRKDDTVDVIKDRLKTYHEQTQPLIDYYGKNGNLKTVSGFLGSKEEIIKAIEGILN